MIQVYAPLSGYYSFSTVAHALIDELLLAGLPITAYDMDPAGLYTRLPDRVAHGVKNGAKVAIAIGPPLMAAELVRRGDHLHRLGMMTWEADAIAPSVVAALGAFQIICVPSEWCLRALHVPVYFQTWVAPHGLSFDYIARYGRAPRYLRQHHRPRQRPRPPRHPELSLLHLCSAYHAPERKGTPELIAAMRRISQKDAHLTIRLPSMADPGPLRQLVGDATHIVVESAPSMGPAGMACLYRSQAALVMPSRAEGFGLPALEARASGIPVAYTSGTGHAMHYPTEKDSGVVHIPSGGQYQHPLETGRWLDVNADDIHRALLNLIEEYSTHAQHAFEGARRLYDQWSWTKQLRPIVTWVKERST